MVFVVEGKLLIDNGHKIKFVNYTIDFGVT